MFKDTVLMKLVNMRGDGCYVHVRQMEDDSLQVSLLGRGCMAGLSDREVCLKVRAHEAEVVASATLAKHELIDWIDWIADY